MTPLEPLPPELGDDLLETESELSELSLVWGTVRAVCRIVMWTAAIALIVAATVDGIFGDQYSRAAVELALVMLFVLFEILEEVRR